jgi:F0F1-type ATP synthase membrane subunit c/vacuolar-type H+-ATPase subunit K
MMVLDTIRTFGWRLVELALMVVVFCVLASIILGEAGGAFVSGVARNAVELAQVVPSGTLVGFALVAAVVWAWRARRP